MNYSKKEAVFMLRKIYILIVLSGVFTIMLYLPSFAEDKEAGPAETGSYIIGPGDILDISVWKDEALTRMPIVLPDGFISFPLIGNIRASGKTVTQLKTEMEGKLARYVPDVILSLDVKQANSMIIYVIGRVNIPGRINLNANVNVLQALATA
ncbi:MAG: polysaccharide export protein, partial [Proteobacteria bacterium]|nr:polysaccharide export protein [Pseudomonadota bacterium]